MRRERAEKRGIRIGLAVTFGVLLVASGCHPQEKRARIELVIWSNPMGTEEEAFHHIIHRFEAEHPGIVIRNTGAVDPIRLIRAIVAGAPPDMAYLYGTSAVGQLAATNAIRPVDADFARAGFRDTDFLPGAIAQGRYKGHLYAMPTTRDSHALYRNRTCFRAAGMDPDHPPQTLNEALDMARRLTRHDTEGTLVQLGLQLPDDPFLLFALFGGSGYDPINGRITANSPANITALRWLVTLADTQGGYRAISAFTAGLGSDTSSQNPLAIGKVAMIMDGEWAAMHIDKFAPGSDYKVSELPYPDGHPELKNMAWQDGDVMLIPNGSRHPEAAWEFMRWMEQPAQQMFYATAMSNLPTIMALRDSPHFQQGSHSNRIVGYIIRHIASNARNARFVPPTPVTQFYMNALRDAFDRALFHDKTPEQALADVQARVEREMRRYD